ncbi:MAG: helix-turn-helix domain-containing protein [Candidatus Dormibacteraceae bacterium]
MTWSTRFGQWLAEADCSVTQAADLTGLSISMVSLLARGKRRASPRTMIKISRRLGVRVEELFDLPPVEEVDLAQLAGEQVAAWTAIRQEVTA